MQGIEARGCFDRFIAWSDVTGIDVREFPASEATIRRLENRQGGFPAKLATVRVARRGNCRVRLRAAVDSPRAHRGSGDVAGHGPAAGPSVPHQGADGHGYLRGLLRRWPGVRLRLREQVYDGCTRLRELFEASGQAYVLRAASSFMITLARGTRVHVLRDDAPRPRSPASPRTAATCPRSGWGRLTFSDSSPAAGREVHRRRPGPRRGRGGSKTRPPGPCPHPSGPGPRATRNVPIPPKLVALFAAAPQAVQHRPRRAPVPQRERQPDPAVHLRAGLAEDPGPGTHTAAAPDPRCCTAPTTCATPASSGGSTPVSRPPKSPPRPGTASRC